MPLPLAQFSGNVARVGQVLATLARYGLADWLARVDPKLARRVLSHHPPQERAGESRDARVRLALTELGTTFIKLGQILSTRDDLVGASLARELSHLQAHTPPDPPDVVRRTVETELGRPIEQLFAAFDFSALASASIGQVHRATLAGGRAVVVKVQRAGIEPTVRSDLEILHALARLAEQHPDLARYRPTALVAEFKQTLLRELEFGREARNLRQFRAFFADDPAVYFPEPIPELSGGRVLTMEYLDGVPLTSADALTLAGCDPVQLAAKGAHVYLEMIFRDGFYHADPHPGNLLALPGGRLAMLDCGMVGRLDERLRSSIESLLQSVARRDAASLTRTICRLCEAPPETDRAALSTDVTDYLTYFGTQSLARLELGAALNELVDIIRRHQLVLPMQVSLLLKVLVMLEGTARMLNPRFQLLEVLEPYGRKMLARRLSPTHQWRRLTALAGEVEYLAATLPQGMADLFERVRTGRFDVHLQHRRLGAAVNRLVLGVMASALFMGSAELWSRQVPPLVWDTSIVGVAGCGVALAIGARLLLAIRSSGQLDSDA